MSFRAMKAERALEEQFIEDEGQKYIMRMEAERDKRQKQNSKQASN